jgi:hypothetical protein
VTGADHVSEAEQLAALAQVHELLVRHRIEYWLFGGWAVDFHAGAITRPHDDLDISVWSKDLDRIAALLAADGWKHAPEEDEDGYTGYARGTVRFELAFLARGEDGEVYTPLGEGSRSVGGRCVRERRRRIARRARKGHQSPRGESRQVGNSQGRARGCEGPR